MITTDEVLHVRDEKTSGTNGGSSIAGQNTRVLNTEIANTITGASLSSNQVTLPAGTYFVDAEAPTHDVLRHRLSIYNVSDTAYEIWGPATYSDGGFGAQRCRMIGVFVITAEKTFELRHYTQSAVATTGLGLAVGEGTIEAYAELVIEKLA